MFVSTDTTQRLAASWLLPSANEPPQARQVIELDAGRIATVRPDPGTGSGPFVLPALANAHDHARVVRLSQVGSYDVPLEAWLPYLALIPAVDPWLASAVAFGRAARHWLDNQLDPTSPAFVPRGHLPVLTNVTRRNWTAIGNVARPASDADMPRVS